MYLNCDSIFFEKPLLTYLLISNWSLQIMSLTRLIMIKNKVFCTVQREQINSLELCNRKNKEEKKTFSLTSYSSNSRIHRQTTSDVQEFNIRTTHQRHFLSKTLLKKIARKLFLFGINFCWNLPGTLVGKVFLL